MNLIESSGTLACWSCPVSKFKKLVVHRAGIKHQAANTLSIFPTSGKDKILLGEDLPLLLIGAMYNPTNTQIFAIYCDMDRIVPLNNDPTKASLNAQPMESELIVEWAQETFCKTVP